MFIFLQVPEEAECKEDGIEIPLEEQMMNMSIVDAETSQVCDWTLSFNRALNYILSAAFFMIIQSSRSTNQSVDLSIDQSLNEIQSECIND